jgi:hypothetical protein
MIIEFGIRGNNVGEYENTLINNWHTVGIYDFIPLDPEFDSTNLAIFDRWYSNDDG